MVLADLYVKNDGDNMSAIDLGGDYDFEIIGTT